MMGINQEDIHDLGSIMTLLSPLELSKILRELFKEELSLGLLCDNIPLTKTA